MYFAKISKELAASGRPQLGRQPLGRLALARGCRRPGDGREMPDGGFESGDVDGHWAAAP